MEATSEKTEIEEAVRKMRMEGFLENFMFEVMYNAHINMHICEMCACLYIPLSLCVLFTLQCPTILEHITTFANIFMRVCVCVMHHLKHSSLSYIVPFRHCYYYCYYYYYCRFLVGRGAGT